MEISTAHRTAEKLLLILLIGLAAIVGLAPACYFFRSPRSMFSFAVEGLLFGSIYLFSRRSDYPVAHGPSVLEYVLRFLSAISFWGALGFLWLLVYGLLYWIARLLNLVLTWFEFEPFNVQRIAYSSSFVLALIFGIGIAAAIAQNISTRLYSARVSSRLASYKKALTGQSRTWQYLFATVAALSVMYVGLWKVGEGRNFWIYFGFQLVPYFAGYWILGLGVRARRDYEIVDAITKLLKSLDYSVVFSLHSKDPTIESLLSGLDMIATKENHALAIQVKTINSSTAPVTWTHGSSLRQKAKALQFPDVCNQIELVKLADKEVRPLMVLVGRDLDESLKAFAYESRLQIVVIDIEDIGRILSSHGAELNTLAKKYFGDEISAQTGPGAPEQSLSTKEGQWALNQQ